MVEVEPERERGRAVRAPVQAQRICIVHRQAAPHPPGKVMHLAKCEVGPCIRLAGWQAGRRPQARQNQGSVHIYVRRVGKWDGCVWFTWVGY